MRHLLVQQYLDEMTSKDPAKVAVTDGCAALSYRDLELFSNRIANRLIAHGVKKQDRVVFCHRRSVAVIAVVLGILKADAVYVPLDCKAPLDRWQDIVVDCSPAAVISDSENRNSATQVMNASKVFVPILQVDDLDGLGFGADLSAVRPGIESDRRPTYKNHETDLAYILYTSGSTGKPKGVMISHHNIKTYIDWSVNYFKITQDDRILGTAPFHFDMSTFDIYCSLKAGGTFCIASDDLTLFPSKLVNFVEQHKITLWKVIPSLLMYMAMANVIAEKRMPSLKQVIFAGEHFPTKYLQQWMRTYPEKTFYNAYGPTEATGVSLCYRVERVPEKLQDKVPIGTPCDGKHVFLCAEDNSLVEPGGVGELCLFGNGLSKGYLNDPLKTAKVFVDFFVNGSRERIYKTGDLAVLLPCGNYQYIGRLDRQLKFMGYRIEAGEVEHAIMSLDGVRDAAVVLRESKVGSGKMGLVAFIESAQSTDALGLRRLRDCLPAYMIPKKFIKIGKLPRCSRGKIKYNDLERDLAF